jgi:hypothetical protein
VAVRRTGRVVLFSNSLFFDNLAIDDPVYGNARCGVDAVVAARSTDGQKIDTFGGLR